MAMEGHRLLVCCVLVLTIYKREVVADQSPEKLASVIYTITESKTADQGTNVFVNFALMVPRERFNKESVDLSFTVEPLNPLALTTDIVESDQTVTVKKSESKTVNVYNGVFEVKVSVTDGVLTGDLSATLSCNDPILCKDSNSNVVETEVVIVKETKTLHVTATPSYVLSQTSPTANVTVTLLKDLATSDKLTLSVSLHDKEPGPEGKNYSQRVPVPRAKSSFPVVFTNIQWGDYQLMIDCGDDSVCSALSQWIHFPDPVSVPAHPSYSKLSKTISDLQGKVTSLSKPINGKTCGGPQDTGNTDNTKADGNTKTDGNTKADGGTKAPSTTRYMKLAVGGLIAALVCGLLGYLLYHYRTKVKEWICSKKVVVSNLPKKLHRNAGSKYTKLPQTMQEALHQD